MNTHSTYPPPRTGLVGYWDKFIGPGATRAEIWVSLVPALSAAVGVLVYAARAGLGWSITQQCIAALLAFDLTGGVVTNATRSAQRWYHRSGQGLQQHLFFVVLHTMHVFLVAWLFRSMDWIFFGVVTGYLLLSAIVVLITPRYLQRAVALLSTCGAIVLGFYLLPPTFDFEWFIPFLFLKLIVSHLVPETP
jgi:hypothetical protein